MLRFLLILIALVVLLRLLGWTPPGAARRQAANPDPVSRPTPSPGRSAAAELVECAHCAVYLPADQALPQDGMTYCCDAHRRAGPRGPAAARRPG